MTTQSLDHTLSDHINPDVATRGRPWWTVPVLVIVLLVLALLAYGLHASDRSQLVDGPVPDVTLQTFDGEAIAVRDLEGKPVIINFWASWCRECDKEMAFLQQAHERYGDDLVILGVDHVDTEARAIAYLETYGITYPSGPDLGGRIASEFNIKGVPETFFVSRDGTIQGMHLGPLTQLDLNAWVSTLLSE